MKVRPDGRVQVFPVGEVIAAGRTPAELQKAMIELLSADFREPRVTIEVAEPAGNEVHVLGQVKKPGSYSAVPFVTVAEAVSKAGGFEDDANKNDVLIFHRDGASAVRVSRVALGRALKTGNLSDDVLLDRFDIVFVPRSPIGNLDVFVRQYFTEIQPALLTVMTGWELFNLDRVFTPTLVQKR
jgi:polysaccharide export outer membrane protein